MRDSFEQIIAIVPEVEDQIRRISNTCHIEEIRVHRGKQIQFYFSCGQTTVPIMVDDALMQSIMDRATQRSYYIAMEMLRKGYLILQGGHRLGVCGTGVYRNEKLRSLRDISSINIRVARDLVGIGSCVVDCLWVHPCSALCIGPPGRGKTTLLRDVIRQLSQRFQQRIGVVDERQELAACIDGRAQFELGPTTDVLSAVGKAEGIEMLLRSMSPMWIALDEITAPADIDAIIQASYCGVKFLATAHANSREDLFSRPIYRELMNGKVFEILFTIDPNRKVHRETIVL